MNVQDWFPLGLTSLISLQSKGLSRVFSNTTVQKHQFFGAHLSFWSSSHIHARPLEKPWPWLYGPSLASDVSAFEYAVLVRHSFSFKERASFNFVAAVTDRSDFGAQEFVCIFLFTWPCCMACMILVPWPRDWTGAMAVRCQVLPPDPKEFPVCVTVRTNLSSYNTHSGLLTRVEWNQ